MRLKLTRYRLLSAITLTMLALVLGAGAGLMVGCTLKNIPTEDAKAQLYDLGFACGNHVRVVYPEEVPKAIVNAEKILTAGSILEINDLITAAYQFYIIKHPENAFLAYAVKEAIRLVGIELPKLEEIETEGLDLSGIDLGLITAFTEGFLKGLKGGG